MNKREKIIVSIAGVALLYGILNYFVFSSFKNNGADSLSPEAAVVDAALSNPTDNTHLNAIELWTKNSKKSDRLVKMIESQWVNDPFAKLDSPIEKEQSLAIPPIENLDFTYSGFIQLGKKLLAVVNGMEYEPGEFLHESNYKIITITPKKIILRRDGNKALMLYLKED